MTITIFRNIKSMMKKKYCFYGRATVGRFCRKNWNKKTLSFDKKCTKIHQVVKKKLKLFHIKHNIITKAQFSSFFCFFISFPHQIFIFCIVQHKKNLSNVCCLLLQKKNFFKTTKQTQNTTYYTQRETADKEMKWQWNAFTLYIFLSHINQLQIYT
jgi:hypothetical protein